MLATAPKPASSHVRRARSSGLVITHAGCRPAKRSPRRRAFCSPWALKGRSVARVRSLSPAPVADLRDILAMLANEFLVLDQLVAQRLLHVTGPRLKLWQAVDRATEQVEAIHLDQHRHVAWCRDGAFFLVAAYVQVMVVCSPVSEPVDQPWITVERKDDGLVEREESVELRVRKPVRVLTRGL